MSFAVSSDAYDRFMGRFSRPLAEQFATLTLEECRPWWRALDVGSGPGILTEQLVHRLGAGGVAAVDPEPRFVAEMQQRWPEADVQLGKVEALPWEDGSFDVTLGQLVLHLVAEAVAAIDEMRRVTAQGGLVAACAWDNAGEHGPLSHFWSVARATDPSVRGEPGLPGCAPGELLSSFKAAGLHDVREARLEFPVHFVDFEHWWEPYTFGVGAAGAFVRTLDDPARDRLVEALRASLPSDGFELRVAAWCALGTA